MKVISIRQPWAWLILCGLPRWKDIENRTWPTKFRGHSYIHAAKGMTLAEYEAGRALAVKCGIYMLPKPEDLPRGGIVGAVEFTGCVRSHRSPWFVGPFGFLMRNPITVPFEPCAGQLGFYEYGTFNAPKWAQPK